MLQKKPSNHRTFEALLEHPSEPLRRRLPRCATAGPSEAGSLGVSREWTVPGVRKSFERELREVQGFLAKSG